jgi:esterase/lipase superfamily enzyme
LGGICARRFALDWDQVCLLAIFALGIAMLFVTNRVFREGNKTQRDRRSVTFKLDDTNALQSVFFCERKGKEAYQELGSENWLKALKESDRKQILLYVHGFNSSPETAVFDRALRLQELLEITAPGEIEVVPVIWPSKGSGDARSVVRDYYDDQTAADGSAIAFARALAKFESWRLRQKSEADVAPCLKRINVLAHSMGNRVLRGALRWWASEIRGIDPPMVFRNIFMAAADVENETLERAHEGWPIPVSAQKVVVYHSFEDLAMRASKGANASIRSVSRRLGHTGPFDMLRTANNVQAVNCDMIAMEYDPPHGHTYFLDDMNGQPGKLFLHMLEAIRKKTPELAGAVRAMAL